MKLSLRKSRPHTSVGVSGPARLDRRTRNITKRLRPGDIAVIDHVDIDRHAALALVEAEVAAVINIAPSISGRYPNLGPELLVEAGIVLLDDVGPTVFQAINDGDMIRVEGDTVFRGETPIGSGTRHDAASVAAAMEASKDGMASQLEAFSANAIEHLRRERGLLLDGEGVPVVTTELKGRQVLVVLRAFDYQRDLASLKMFIRENSPVLIGVDAGADALLEAGYRPDVIVTDADEISDKALRCGAEVVAHATAG
ncbi:MAG: putative cytokinetic ring protein SteA, partial [Nocardioidaceae bacterium]